MKARECERQTHKAKSIGRLKQQLFLYLVLILSLCASSAYPQDLISYCNDRYGFCLEYPGGLVMEEPPTNGDGRRFHDPNGFLLVASGINNVLGDTLESERQSHLKQFERVTYQARGRDWFVLSGYKGADIIYLKTYVGTGSVNHLHMKYPSSRKRDYAKTVAGISRSFKPGDLTESH